jgi:hypothetical protein
MPARIFGQDRDPQKDRHHLREVNMLNLLEPHKARERKRRTGETGPHAISHEDAGEKACRKDRGESNHS